MKNKITLEELQTYFKRQLTADPAPTEVTYEMAGQYDKRKLKHPADKLETLIPLLEGWQFDAYRVDNTVVFVVESEA